jgi:uncharacterized protein (TIGR00255 family)
MIKSMTGFGRCEMTDETRKMKSVNHRYLETGIKMPKKLNVFEARMREVLKKYIQRGKVDIFITYEDYAENKVSLKYNTDIADEYMNIFDRMSRQFELKNDVSISRLASFPEVITMEEQAPDEDAVWNFIREALDGACRQLVDTRLAEGERLKDDLVGKLDSMEEMVGYIEERSPQIMSNYRSKLLEKVNELLGDTTIDESRIATEVVLYADKICVDEETVRLKSHIRHARESLLAEGTEGVGRKLDFIAQEMNREANTILSKADDIDVSNKAIDIKTEIEKVREQIQNIE